MKFAVNNKSALLVAATIVLSAVTGVSAHPANDDKLIESIVARHIVEGREFSTDSKCGYLYVHFSSFPTSLSVPTPTVHFLSFLPFHGHYPPCPTPSLFPVRFLPPLF